MSTAALVLGVVGNVLNIAYNIPLVWRVVKLWDAHSLSLAFIFIRILAGILFVIYAALVRDIIVGVSYVVTLTSSLVLFVVKVRPSKLDAAHVTDT